MNHCDSPDHFELLIIYGECHHCHRVWGLDNTTEHEPSLQLPELAAPRPQ